MPDFSFDLDVTLEPVWDLSVTLEPGAADREPAQFEDGTAWDFEDGTPQEWE